MNYSYTEGIPAPNGPCWLRDQLTKKMMTFYNNFA